MGHQLIPLTGGVKHRRERMFGGGEMISVRYVELEGSAEQNGDVNCKGKYLSMILRKESGLKIQIREFSRIACH